MIPRPMTDQTEGSGPHAPTVVIAVPELLFADALLQIFCDQGIRVAGRCGRLDVLLSSLGRWQPDLVFVDAMLDPAAGTAGVLAQLREAAPQAKLVVVTDELDGRLARAVVSHGVSGVILKSAALGDAIGILKQVLAGQSSFPSVLLERLRERSCENELSPRQLEVLERLALGRSNEEIARELFISTNTVKFHLRAIYERPSVHNRVEAARLLAARRAD
jgi:NarL family two-component system response regulator LiaR